MDLIRCSIYFGTSKVCFNEVEKSPLTRRYLKMYYLAIWRGVKFEGERERDKRCRTFFDLEKAIPAQIFSFLRSSDW